MGKSSPGGGGAPSGAPAESPFLHESGHTQGPAPTPHDTFGQIFSHILEQKYPLAGGLAHMVFGGGPQDAPGASAPPPGYGQMATAPLPQMQDPGQPDFSLIAQNAKPPSGGGAGLSSLLSLFH